MTETQGRPGMPHEAMIGEAAGWLVRLRDPACSAATREAFERWLGRDEANRAEFARAERAWQDVAALEGELPDLVLAREKLAAHRERAGNAGRRQSFPAAAAWWKLPALASTAVVFAFIGYAWFVENVPTHRASYATSTGESRQVRPEDGTRIDLNTASSIVVTLYRNRREVTLERGEAWFEVARDADRPFRVDAGALNVEVTGTRFTVRRLNHETSVAVEEGSVQIFRAGNLHESVLLAKGEGVQVVPAGGPLQTIKVALDQQSAWREGRLIFSARPLGEVAAELSRYRNVPVRVAMDAARLPVTAVINIRAMDDWLAFLPKTLPVQASRTPAGGWDVVAAAPVGESPAPIAPARLLPN